MSKQVSKKKRKSQYSLGKSKETKNLELPLPDYVEAGPEEKPFDWPERSPVFWQFDDPEQLSLFPHKNFFEELKTL